MVDEWQRLLELGAFGRLWIKLRDNVATRSWAPYYLIFSVVWLSGCGLYFRQWHLGDGNTWQVNAAEVSTDCNGYSSAASCVESLQPKVEAHALVICGKKPYRVFLCEKMQNAVNGLVGIGCKVQCNEGAQVQVIEAESKTGEAPVSAEVMEKAKKCQAKGGVWLNGACQISLD